MKNNGTMGFKTECKEKNKTVILKLAFTNEFAIKFEEYYQSKCKEAAQKNNKIPSKNDMIIKAIEAQIGEKRVW